MQWPHCGIPLTSYWCRNKYRYGDMTKCMFSLAPCCQTANISSRSQICLVLTAFLVLVSPHTVMTHDPIWMQEAGHCLLVARKLHANEPDGQMFREKWTMPSYRDAPQLVVIHFNGLISFHISQVQGIPVEVDFKHDNISGFCAQVWLSLNTSVAARQKVCFLSVPVVRWLTSPVGYGPSLARSLCPCWPHFFLNVKTRCTEVWWHTLKLDRESQDTARWWLDLIDGLFGG